MYAVCAIVFAATVVAFIAGYRRMAGRAELERAERLLADEIDALGSADRRLRGLGQRPAVRATGRHTT